MPKVKTINKAGKDYPEFGIKKGETHYVWSIKMQRGGVVRRSKTYPRQSQLTMSEYKVQAHLLNEKIEDFDTDIAHDVEEFRDELVSEAEDLRDEQQNKLDSMPEGLQSGGTGELIQERINALDSFIDDLQNLEFEDFEQCEDEEDSEGNPVNDQGETDDQYGQRLCAQLKEISLDVA